MREYLGVHNVVPLNKGVLTMGNDKETSPEAASDSSDVLRDDRTGDKSKTAAGSALSQAEGNENNPPDSGKGKGDKKD
jgi:hypothetical protein